MPARSEGELRTHPSEFTVRATGADQLFQWLNVHNNAPDTDVVMGLGQPERLDDGLTLATMEDAEPFRGIVWGIVVDREDGSYELVEKIVPRSPIPKSMMGHVLSRTMASREPLEVVDVASLENSLKIPLSKIGFKTQTSNGNGFSIVIREPSPAVDPETRLRFHENGSILIEDYCLHLKGNLSEDQDTFTRKYEVFTQIARVLTTTLYRTLAVTPPTNEVVLKPPKDLSKKLDRMSQQHKRQRRIREMAGIDEIDPEEIRSRMVIERRPSVTFGEIGGLDRAKQELEGIVSALKNPSVYEDWGTSPPKGVLLFGPPGTGKTLLAKALANAAEATLFSVQATDIVHSLFGRSEQLVQAVFDAARAEKGPVVIFLDEIDALTQHRGRSTEVTSRIVSTILTNLDGLEGSTEGDGRIIVMGTTNQLDAIDRALLRPGRLDVLVEVPLPGDPERKKIFEIHMGAALRRAQGRDIFDPSLDLNSLVGKTQGFSGADIKEIIRRALAVKVRQQGKGEQPTPVTTTDVFAEIDAYERVRKVKDRMGFRRADTNHND